MINFSTDPHDKAYIAAFMKAHKKMQDLLSTPSAFNFKENTSYFTADNQPDAPLTDEVDEYSRLAALKLAVSYSEWHEGGDVLDLAEQFFDFIKGV